MKITKVLIKKLNINSVWTPVICRIYTDSGIYGDGEAAVAFGTGASGAFGLLKDYGKVILGMDPMKNEVVWDKLYKTTFWAQAGGSIVWSAISAIDMALWDIKGKALGVPIHMLLGGKREDSLRCYASQLQFGWSDHFEALGKTEEYVAASRKAVEEGYDAIKIDFFTFDENGDKFQKKEMMGILSYRYLHLLEERISAVREAVGPEVDIIMENHSNLDLSSAIQIAGIAEKYGICLFEEPTTPNVRTNRLVSERINLPIAHGERIFTRWQYAPYFADGSIHVIQPDIGTCGGLTEAKKICDMAYVYEVGVQAHVCASPLSTAAALHLEAAIPNFYIHEHHRNCLYPHNKILCTKDFQPVNGKIEVPDEPGLSCEFTEETLARTDADTAIVSE